MIAHPPPEDLYFTAHSAAELHALRTLGGRPRLQLVGDIAVADIRALHLAPDTPDVPEDVLALLPVPPVVERTDSVL